MRRTVIGARALGLGLAVLVTSAAWALVPSHQASVANEVVRIYGTDPLNNRFIGTGTVIEKQMLNNQQMYMCILTADHVLRDGQTVNMLQNIEVGWFDDNSPNQFLLSTAYGLASYWTHGKFNFFNADVGLLNVIINVQTLTQAERNTLNAVNPRTVAPAPNNPGYTITNRGYGRTGDRIDNVLGEFVGYRTVFGDPAHRAGKLRFQDNHIDKYAFFQDDPVNPFYAFNAMFYALERSDMPNYVPFEGYGLSGDSGSAFLDGPGGAAQVIGVFTNSEGRIIRDNTGARIAEEYYLGFRGFGPRITDGLWNRIMQLCPVPEPTTIAALSLGSLLLLARRRRASR